MEELLKTQKRRIKTYAIIFATVLLTTLTLTYLVAYQGIFKAEVLTYLGGVQPQAVNDYYIPYYTAQPGSQGEIEFIANTNISFHGTQFELHFNDSLVDAVGIITDGTNLIGTTVLPSLNETHYGASIAVVTADPITLHAGDLILKIRMIVDNNAPQGTEIPLTVNNAEIIAEVNGDLVTNPSNVDAGKIVVTGQSVEQGLLIKRVAPSEISNKKDELITITGDNFLETTQVYIGQKPFDTTFQNTQTLTAFIGSGSLSSGLYNVYIKNPYESPFKAPEDIIVSDKILGEIAFVPSTFITVPDRVTNDGTTPVTLWVGVQDPLGVANITSVNADLRGVGGVYNNTMVPDRVVEHVRYYKLTVTIPSTVATSDDPYLIPVTATNSANKNALSTIPVLVTKQSAGSVAPTIVKSFAQPSSGNKILPGETISFYANVNDNDGINDIKSVIINLQSIGGGIATMTPVIDANATPDANTKITDQWYSVEGFKLPLSIQVLKYTLEVEAIDSTGEKSVSELILEISLQESTYILDFYTKPARDIVAGDNVSFYVKVRNLAGIQEISDVIINLTDFGGDIIPMVPMSTGTTPGSQNFPGSFRDASTEQDETIANTTFITSDQFSRAGGSSNIGNASDGAFVTTQWYLLLDYPLPLNSYGAKEVKIEVLNRNGLMNGRDYTVEVHSPADAGRDGPKIDEIRSYTNPYVAINDAKTPITVYSFIQHTADIDNVIMNLAHIGVLAPNESLSSFQPTPTTPPDTNFQADLFSDTAPAPARSSSQNRGGCMTNSNTILCMEFIAREGNIGSWFKSPPIVINETTIPSTDPYFAEVTATDSQGRIGQGVMAIIVNDGGKYVTDNIPPGVKLAVSTSPTSVELLFSEELDPATIKVNGGNFKITDFNDISQGLGITRATLNATSTIVTLTTIKQKKGVNYAVTADNMITDAIGIPIAKGASDRARFIGYETSNIPPTVRTVTSTSPETIEIVFTAPLSPSSLDLTFKTPEGVKQALTRAPRPEVGHIYTPGQNFHVRTSGVKKEELPVSGVYFGKDAHVLVLETAVQQPNVEYLLSGSNFASYNGIEIKKGRLNKYFRGYITKLTDAPQLRRSADFNEDGKVDFIDFTIFASFYGKALGGEITENPIVTPPEVQTNEPDENQNPPPENPVIETNPPANNNPNIINETPQTEPVTEPVLDPQPQITF